ncbi:hypothetical protein DES53_104125 [Roseimicrobium gellanilyticum]|uniref:Uncharacterized protein n=1 Tax=Roseimicrobium gellanilyticum TaxID=748857 RepID=A0A366HNE2_9BACT|nr:hypothetical protein [Roseimicrobium gellanilyticum]RBP44306.1 hypothetical protein DES53_104125 [Roseimicrobium gellanilyticum]
MSLWTNKDRRTHQDDADAFAYDPNGGGLKQWLVGAVLPFFMVLYGITCLSSDQTDIFGPDGRTVAYGTAATGLVVAFIALGCFLHFHFFWRLNERLEPYAARLKSVSLLVFLGGFLFSILRRLDLF